MCKRETGIGTGADLFISVFGSGATGQVWCPQIKNIDALEKVQGRAVSVMSGLESTSCRGRLKEKVGGDSMGRNLSVSSREM